MGKFVIWAKNVTDCPQTEGLKYEQYINIKYVKFCEKGSVTMLNLTEIT